MNPRFVRHLKIVAAVHVGAVVLLICLSGIRDVFPRKNKLSVPVEFVVEAPAEEEEGEATIPKPPEPQKEEAVPKPVPPEKKKIRRSWKKVRKQTSDTQKPRLTAEEIRKLLAQGAEISDHTSIPDEEVRCLELIRRTLYNAWVTPSEAQAGDAVVEVSIRFALDGAITERRIARKSGNTVMDESVQKAIDSVNRINGLTPRFLRDHAVVTVSFKVGE